MISAISGSESTREVSSICQRNNVSSLSCIAWLMFGHLAVPMAPEMTHVLVRLGQGIGGRFSNGAHVCDWVKLVEVN